MPLRGGGLGIALSDLEFPISRLLWGVAWVNMGERLLKMA